MIRLEVHDEHGEAVVYVDEPSSDVLEQLAPAIDAIPRDQRDAVLARLIRRVADEQAYARICADRGLLPC